MLDPADKAYEKYDKRMGSGRVGSATVMPHPDEEPTGEQLSSLHGIDQAKSPPYVDFAVWGPYANRNRRRLVFKGWNIAADGDFHIAEVRGPSNLEEWKACLMSW